MGSVYLFFGFIAAWLCLQSTPEIESMHKLSWAFLLGLSTLGLSAKPPSSLRTIATFPLVGIKNWLVNWRSNRLSQNEQLASCATRHLDDNPPPTGRVTVQLFQWRYSDVGNECEAFLGPNGYRYVQISPPHEHIEGPQWWTDYQPVSYRIGSKRGSEAEFDAMVQRCASAGVGVIVDVVFNHMSAGSITEARRGSAGSSYRKYEYSDASLHPFLYSLSSTLTFPPFLTVVSGAISRSATTWTGTSEQSENQSLRTKRHQTYGWVQNCELVGLADLKTSQRHVQNQLRRYLARLVEKGVTGLRVDAAKHIPVRDLLDILRFVPLRVVQEIMYTGGEPIRPEEYSTVGRVHIFQAAYDLKRMFLSDGIAYLGHPVPWGPQWGDGYLPSSQSQIFVTNWDLERNEHSIRIDQHAGPYLLCQVFILTWGYGQVDVFSGFNFTAYDEAPQDPVAQCGRFGWRCEHRHPMIIGAIQLGAAASDEPVQNIVTSGAHRLAFSRGSKVFVAINNDDSDWLLEDVVVGLPLPASPGDAYRDRLHPSGDGQLVHLQSDPSCGLTRLRPLSIPPRSAIGIMVFEQ
ncbi:hypothetical protein PSHT_08527 [Puccinia striiformis]|uniref:Alpha-amylase n=1 Tax=Puccinia striiformis TaxID=27350 RepID=A0A2S4VP85_9BASI|nr:hypothetical protein PSHT_08527 [Puccinia striiformis]